MSAALLFAFLASSLLSSLLMGEGAPLELKLQVVNYLGVWDDRPSRNVLGALALRCLAEVPV